MDDRGEVSAPAVSSFSSYTIAPTVEFVQPRAAPLIAPQVPPNTTFLWTGTDPDGRHGKRPLYYRYHLFSKGNSEFDFFTLQLHPDSLRRHYAPDFVGWDSISGDTCRLLVLGMTPGVEQILAVVAFDEAGAYSPVFSFDGNLLHFICTYPTLLGPRLTVWNEYFTYSYSSGSYSVDPGTFLHLEVPSGRTIYFNWSAVPYPGSAIRSYRWVMDIRSLDDETPRTDEALDWTHWSHASSLNTTAAVGPFPGTGPDSLEQHTLYIEAEDTNQLKSLAVIQFRVLRPASHPKPLLFVDDTRLTPDGSTNVRPDSVIAPGGTWPSAAELDTFLYARGGVRWRDYVPVTTQSTPGIFNGYDFDTIGTRGLYGGTIPLATLAQYRQVVWYCDPAVDFTSSLDHPRKPQPLLRWISAPGHGNALTAFSEMGGSTWLMGGGIAYNSLLPWNTLANDITGRAIDPRTATVFSAAAGEIVAGRVMFHTAHWRSEIKMKTPLRALRNVDLVAWPGGPDYSGLPGELRERTVQTDPLPPMRSSFSYYTPYYFGEVLTLPNPISGGVLDTLYFATYGDVPLGQNLPVMTYYHGPDCGPCVFSGFPLWYFQRAQAMQLADFVLQGIWGLERRPVPR